MNIFENFNKAKQKFGDNLARQAIEGSFRTDPPFFQIARVHNGVGSAVHS